MTVRPISKSCCTGMAWKSTMRASPCRSKDIHNPLASWSVQSLRRRWLSLVDDEDRLGMRAGVGVRVPHCHDIERTAVFHNCHVPPGPCCLVVGVLPGALLIIELGGLHGAPFAPRCLKTTEFDDEE